MNKRMTAFGGYTRGSEDLLEQEARKMLRGLIKIKKQYVCEQLITLGKHRASSRGHA